MHDFNKGYYDALKEVAPVYCLGNSLSPHFVDRFYSLLANFSHAVGASTGSQSYFCHEYGVHYFTHPFSFEIINNSDVNIPLGSLNISRSLLRDRALKKEQILFSYQNCLSDATNSWVNSMLGVGYNGGVLKCHVKFLFKLQLLRLAPLIISSFFKKVYRMFFLK